MLIKKTDISHCDHTRGLCSMRLLIPCTMWTVIRKNIAVNQTEFYFSLWKLFKHYSILPISIRLSKRGWNKHVQICIGFNLQCLCLNHSSSFIIRVFCYFQLWTSSDTSCSKGNKECFFNSFILPISVLTSLGFDSKYKHLSILFSQ